MSRIIAVMCFTLFGFVVLGYASESNGFQIQILIDGSPIPEYFHNGTTYIEAIKGKDYAIRMTNPLGIHVAVALSVDGLNTIDARHTDAFTARKWVLGPYESVTISGWQTNSHQARRFFFTTEENSYGSWLGKKENLGVISAVFFKERTPLLGTPSPQPLSSMPQEGRSEAKESDGRMKSADESAVSKPRRDEYAATGIGTRIHNEVQWVRMDLDPQPGANLNLRYEFRPVLTSLGVIPRPFREDPFSRRQNARGFSETGYCPDPR